MDLQIAHFSTKSLPEFSGIERVVGDRGRLQFCRPQKLLDALMPPYHCILPLLIATPPLPHPSLRHWQHCCRYITDVNLLSTLTVVWR